MKRTEWSGYYDYKLEKICKGDILVRPIDGHCCVCQYINNEWVFVDKETNQKWISGTADTTYIIIAREYEEE